MSELKHTYNVHLKWDEGKTGTLTSPALPDAIQVATPPEFEGGVPGIWSPEHLFTASVSSCFMTTFTAIAEYSKLEYQGLKVDAIATLEKIDGKFMMSTIVLKAELTINDAEKQEKAVRILEKSEAACLITRSVKTNVILEPAIKVI